MLWKTRNIRNMRQEKAEKFKQLKNKKGTKDYERYFLRYIPAEEDKNYKLKTSSKKRN